MRYSCVLGCIAIFGFFLFSCNIREEKTTPRSFGPKVVEAHGYVVPADSMAVPKSIVVDESKLKKIPAGKPNVVPTNTNIHLAGTPKVVLASAPRICTPGQDTFQLPKILSATVSSLVAGIPEVVLVKDPSIKDPNPQNFCAYSTLQGMQNRHINEMLEDHFGNLWIGTAGGGATKFDGKFFTHFTMKEGMLSQSIASIFEDKTGNIWFGTYERGVCKYDGHTFTYFNNLKGLSDSNVTSIIEDQSGNLWFGTDGNGIFRYDTKTFTQFTTAEGLPHNSIFSILEDHSGNLWFGTGKGVCKYDGTSFSQFVQKEGIPNLHVRAILQDHSGNLWFGIAGGGVSKYDGNYFTHYTEQEGLTSNDVNIILEDQLGNLWFGTEDRGICKFDGTYFFHFTTTEGLSNNIVRCIVQDKSGNLWFGTSGGGVNKFNGQLFTHFTGKEGLYNNDIQFLLEDKSGNLWIGARNEGVSKYNGQSFSYYTKQQGLPKNSVSCIMEDRAGNLWFGLRDVGVRKFTGNYFTTFTEKEGLPLNNVISILEDKSGNLWFGTNGEGVCKYDGQSFTQFTQKQGLTNNVVECMLEDKGGKLWFGTRNGITKYDGTYFTKVTGRDVFSDNDIRCMQEDKYGNLWFGTYSEGLIKYNGKTFTQFTVQEGLPHMSISSIKEDHKGNLWIGTSFGIGMLSNEKITEFSDHPIAISNGAYSIFFKNYTYEDGFLGINGKTICIDNTNLIWIGTRDRLTACHLQHDVITQDTTGPHIELTGVKLFNEQINWSQLEHPLDTSIRLENGVKVNHFRFDSLSRWYGLPQNLSLAHNSNYLNFTFVGITQKSPNKVKYQYTLVGNDENWNAISSLTEAHYGNLAHGKYTFKVKAMNSEGMWSNEFHYPFTIRPPWWLTWWAYSLYAMGTITLLWRLHKYQQARTIRLERERIQAKDLEQAKEIEKAYNQLETAHQNLKSTQAQLIQSEKMASLGQVTAGIAHEIQNPLNFINNFSEVNEELLMEMKDEMDKGNIADAKTIANDAIENQQKILFHGKRADAIVKSMLQHSRTTSGVKEPTDINALADEYLRLAYHGMRAKDKNFNATMKTEFDERIGMINVVPQDIGRVILNLITNAFYAVNEKQKSLQTPSLMQTPYPLEGGVDFVPTVTVTTKKLPHTPSHPNSLRITVSDNGPGIPHSALDKIFQPFFTTKPTGQGTGLGLSLSYDIIKSHGGEISVQTKEGEGTEFIILLPIS